MIEKSASEATPDSLRGTVVACCLADRAELADLYRAAYPRASAEDLAADIRDADLSAWASYRDDTGKILLAMLVRTNGVVWLLARPSECGSDESAAAFLTLARAVRRELAKYGVVDLAVIHPSSLQPLTRRLQAEGFLGKESAVLRMMHFDESGEVTRTN